MQEEYGGGGSYIPAFPDCGRRRIRMKDRPNMVFILADDQGAWAMHCAGAEELYTPNLDRIAEAGMRFTDFFCVSPVCSPARASLLTGTIPSAPGVHDWIRSGNVDAEKFAAQGKENPYQGGYSWEWKPTDYLEGQLTYPALLSGQGYQCALAGKWHLGDSVRCREGFSRWYTIALGGCFYYHPDIVEQGTITVRHGSYVTELITDKALEYLEEMAGEEQPFYLSVHYTAPHSPWGAEHHPAKWTAYYRDCTFADIPDIPDHPDMTTGPVYGTSKRRENLTGYFAAISAMDEQIGRLLDRLAALGLDKNTLVIYTADNGMSMGHHGIWGKGNGTFPMNMYDTAVKVPFLASWPGHIPPGQVCGEMVSAYDVFPTLLELGGVSAPGGRALPGRSFADLLKGTDTDRGDNAVVVYDEYGPVRMIRTREWKYIHRYPYGKNELYDMKKDPGEKINLIDKESAGQQVTAMRHQMERWFQTYTDKEIDGAKEGVTGSGQLCLAGTWGDRKEIYAPQGK